MWEAPCNAKMNLCMDTGIRRGGAGLWTPPSRIILRQVNPTLDIATMDQLLLLPRCAGANVRSTGTSILGGVTIISSVVTCTSYTIRLISCIISNISSNRSGGSGSARDHNWGTYRIRGDSFRQTYSATNCRLCFLKIICFDVPGSL